MFVGVKCLPIAYGHGCSKDVRLWRCPLAPAAASLVIFYDLCIPPVKKQFISVDQPKQGPVWASSDDQS